MRKLLFSWLAFGALTAAAVTHPAIAGALEPIWLTEGEMDGVTAGLMIVDSATWTQVTTLSGGTAVTSTTIACNGCAATVSINQASGSSMIVTSVQ